METDNVKLREIKPALANYIRETQSLLRMKPFPDDKAVHDIRVLMKKCRAVMRLISSQIDEDFFKRNYEVFSETGRVLSAWRDTSVHRKTLKDLKKNHPGIFSSLQAHEKLQAMMKKPLIPDEPAPKVDEDLNKIETMLNKSGFRLRFLKMDNLDPEILLKELESSFKLAMDKFLICRNNPKIENIHIFRKKSKDFLYQLWFFRPLNPSVIKSLEKKLDAMTQNLGKFNDLAQLIIKLEYKYSGEAEPAYLDELVILIREAQDRYLLKVWPAAHKIFHPGRKLINVLGFKLLTI